MTNSNRPPQCCAYAMGKFDLNSLLTDSNYLQLDLELKDGKSAGDTSSFITNGEWELIGNE